MDNTTIDVTADVTAAAFPRKLYRGGIACTLGWIGLCLLGLTWMFSGVLGSDEIPKRAGNGLAALLLLAIAGLNVSAVVLLARMAVVHARQLTTTHYVVIGLLQLINASGILFLGFPVLMLLVITIQGMFGIEQDWR